MKDFLYRLIIFCLIVSLGFIFYFNFQEKVYSQGYDFDYREDTGNMSAVSDFWWLEPLKIEKKGYYLIKIRPDLLSLENQTHHILGIFDKNDDLVFEIQDWLYSEVVTDRTSSPEDGEPFAWSSDKAYDKVFEKKVAKKLFKFDNVGEYKLKYLGYKDFSNLDSESVYFFIYKVVNPYLVGVITLILAVLSVLFIPRFFKLEKILSVFKNKKNESKDN